MYFLARFLSVSLIFLSIVVIKQRLFFSFVKCVVMKTRKINREIFVRNNEKNKVPVTSDMKSEIIGEKEAMKQLFVLLSPRCFGWGVSS